VAWRCAIFIICLCAGLSACSSNNLSPVNPTGVDLSGTWLIDFSESGTVADLGTPRSSANDQARSRRQALRIAKGSDLEFISVDFQVLKADKLDIELSKDSMGIRYHPGVYRDISWGERKRGLWEVNAGWEERDLVIVSKAGNLRVVETLRRVQPNQLTVHVAIEIDGDEKEILRVFNRRAR